MALSPGAEEVACIAGVQSSFAEASAKVLPKLAGLQLGESTVERTTEAAHGFLIKKGLAFQGDRGDIGFFV